MDLLKNRDNFFKITQDYCIIPTIEDINQAQTYLDYCLTTDKNNINNYNTINFEKLISIYIEFKDADEQVKKDCEIIFQQIAKNYKFKQKKKHRVLTY